MDEQLRSEILRLLAEGTENLRTSLDGIEEAEAIRKPADGRWSVLDCLEHVAVTERVLLAQVQSATPAEGPQHNPVREAKILDRALDRTRLIPAPEVVIPPGRLQSVTDALAQFEGTRAETIRFVEEFNGDLRTWLTIHPMVRGPVNCYEMLLMMALHPKRHAQQIAQTRAMAAADRHP